MTPQPLGWLQSPSHIDWLRSEERRLLAFPRRGIDAHGDAPVLAFDGSPSTDTPTMFATARMAHVRAIAALRGEPGSRRTAFALLDRLAEFSGTGWPETRDDSPADEQGLYTLAFVILASSSGRAIGHPGSAALWRAALARLDSDFWEASVGRAADIVRHGAQDPYRGLNSTMHLTEALYAAAQVSEDAAQATELRRRAEGLCAFAISVGEQRDWRLCEHFDADWTPRPELNRETPDDTFKPYGATVGHGFEWSRLIAQASPGGPDGFLTAAIALFDRAAADGWKGDAGGGFLYTTDWDGSPVSTLRLHWVAAEAVAAAAVLHRLTGEDRFASQYETWLDFIAEHFVDREHGSWVHRLDEEHAPKPDLYHAYQAVLLPQLPVGSSVVGAVRASLL